MRRTVLWGLLGLAMALPVRAQTEAEPPATYALTNARVVVAPGRAIEGATVVIRNGRIAAVGAQVQVPTGAVVMDLAGRTVYPGLIDAASTVGVPSVAARPVGGAGGGGPAARAASQAATEIPPEMRAHRSAGDEFAPSDTELESLRAQGITAVGLVFDGGLLPGQVAAALAGSGEPRSLVVRSPVAQQVAFGRRRGGYPGTLMGAVAYVRQAYYDAQHAMNVETAFARNPASAPRPVHDPRHDALQASLRGEIPAWIEASAQRDFARAAETVRDVGLRSWAVLGAQEAYLAINDLKAMGVPLIVSLNWPRPNAVTGRAFELHVAPAQGTDSAAIKADSAVARQLRENPAKVAAAGITFALSGHGLDSPSQFRERVIAAVEAGLSKDDALRAVTVTPASLLGLSGLLGTVEAGKLANLVVVEGDLFDKDGKIRHVFVEGRAYEIRQAERARATAGAGGSVEIAGDWQGSIEMAGQTMPFTLSLSGSGDAVTGTLTTELGATPLAGELTGNELILRGSIAPPGMNAMELTVTGRIANDELRGTLSVQGQPPVPFTARRRGPGTHAYEGGAR